MSETTSAQNTQEYAVRGMQSPKCMKVSQQHCIVPAGQAGSPWAAQLPGRPGCWNGCLTCG